MKLVDELLSSGLIGKTDSLTEAFYSSNAMSNNQKKMDDREADDNEDHNEVGVYAPSGGVYKGPEEEAKRKLITELCRSSVMAMMSAKQSIESLTTNLGARLSDQIKMNLAEIVTRVSNDADYLVKLKNEYGDNESDAAEDDLGDETAERDRAAKEKEPDAGIEADVSGIDAMIQ